MQFMSRKGKWSDNELIEGVFWHFKDEVAYENCKLFAELRKIIDEYTHIIIVKVQYTKKLDEPHQIEDNVLFGLFIFYSTNMGSVHPLNKT